MQLTTVIVVLSRQIPKDIPYGNSISAKNMLSQHANLTHAVLPRQQGRINGTNYHLSRNRTVVPHVDLYMFMQCLNFGILVLEILHLHGKFLYSLFLYALGSWHKKNG